MRIPDYRFSAPVKENYWSQKKLKVKNVCKEEFAEELDEAFYQKKSKKIKNKFKQKKTPEDHITWV